MIKELILDTETTGLIAELCSVVQIAAIYQEDGVEIDSINLKFRPHLEYMISPKALEVTNVSYKELMSRKLSQFEAYTKFLYYLDSKVVKFDKKDKMYLIGYNVGFDLDFLLEFFKSNNNNYLFSYFHWPTIDIAQLLSWHTMKSETRSKLENFKLGTVAKQLGIEVDESLLHDAMGDTILTQKIYNLLTKER